jgi:hypothetical protein
MGGGKKPPSGFIHNSSIIHRTSLAPSTPNFNEANDEAINIPNAAGSRCE